MIVIPRTLSPSPCQRYFFWMCSSSYPSWRRVVTESALLLETSSTFSYATTSKHPSSPTTTERVTRIHSDSSQASPIATRGNLRPNDQGRWFCCFESLYQVTLDTSRELAQKSVKFHWHLATQRVRYISMEHQCSTVTQHHPALSSQRHAHTQTANTDIPKRTHTVRKPRSDSMQSFHRERDHKKTNT